MTEMKAPLDNMILKFLDKKAESSNKEKVTGLVKEFKLSEAVATEWVEKLYARHKDNMERFNPRKSTKKNSYSY